MTEDAMRQDTVPESGEGGKCPLADIDAFDPALLQAPEMLHSTQTVGKTAAVDIFPFGVIVLEARL